MNTFKLTLGLAITLGFARTLTGADFLPGVVIPWGRYDSGQLQVPVDLTNAVAIAAGFRHSLALRADGTVVAWGANDEGETVVPAGLNNVVALAAGGLHNLALRDDATVVAWGYNDFGQADVPADLRAVVAVAGGRYHSLALRSDGTIVGWGRNIERQCDPPADATNVVAISAGGNHSVALRRDGTVVAWGTEPEHEMQPPSDWTNIAMIVCGDDHAVVLRRDHTVSGWAFSAFGGGWGQTNLPAGLTNIVALAAGTWNCLALRADGVVLAWGKSESGESTVPMGLTNAVALAAGTSHSLALVARQRPFVVAEPADTAAFTGTRVELVVVASGTEPLSYQWQRESADLPGATGSRLAWGETELGDAGHYCVVVSNTLGAVTSRVVTLSMIEQTPFVVSQPADQSVFPGCPVSFEVTADGSRPLGYEWRFNGSPIPSATNARLVFARVTEVDAGGYAVTVTSSFGSVTSRTANLTVRPLPTGPGSLDVTFDPTAAGTIPGIEADEWPPFVGSLLLQADGKLLIGGRFDRINGVARRGLARLDGCGTLDITFQFLCTNEVAVIALVQQSDGKLVLIGRRVYPGDSLPPYTGLLRLQADGSFDTAFTNFWSDDWVPYLRCLALQTDGKILVGGEFVEPRCGVVRFHPDGRLDETFQPPLFPAYDGAGVNRLIVQPDGKILVSGDWGIGLVRLNPEGSLDTTFNTAVEPGIEPTSMVLLPDGRIVVAQTLGCGRTTSLVQLRPDGSVEVGFGPELDVLPLTMVRQPDGRLLVAGTVSDLGRDARIYLLGPDGIPDGRFQAWVRADLGLPRVSAMLLQPDGQVVIGGWFSSVNQIPIAAVARLKGEVLPVLTPLGLSAQGFRIGLAGLPNATYWLEGSTDLLNWVVAGCVTNSPAGRAEFTDAAARPPFSRYFRARPVAGSR